MLTQELTTKAQELKEGGGRDEGRRAAVVELKAEVQRSGGTARELASVLGVHESTLCRWGREVGVSGRGRRRSVTSPDQAESKFRLVTVTAETAETSRALVFLTGSLGTPNPFAIDVTEKECDSGIDSG